MYIGMLSCFTLKKKKEKKKCNRWRWMHGFKIWKRKIIKRTWLIVAHVSTTIGWLWRLHGIFTLEGVSAPSVAWVTDDHPKGQCP